MMKLNAEILSTIFVQFPAEYLSSVSGPENSWSGSTYSNLNQLTEQVSRNGSAAAVLLSKNVTDYDNRGRVYRTTTWAVNPSTGALGNSLVSNTWYDQGGNVIKSLPAGSSLFSRTMYDILGRATSQYTGYDLDESTYAEALTVTDDTILEQSSSSYNEVGSVLSVTAKQRYHDAPASQTGALGTPTTSPKARVTYSASWYDGTGRATAAADYGTNGGAAFTRPSTPPAAADTILVSVTSFNSDGEVQSVTDPAGMVTQLEYDAAGRRVTQIENYVSGGTQADQNRTTWTTYTPDGQVATLTASNSSTGNQQTTYTYGTTLSNSAIASSQLLRWVQYPDSSGSGGDYVTYSYNRQGQQTLVTDQGGCQHAFDYDGLGRQIHDRVLTLGTTAIGNARRISTVYDSRGLVSTISTWDDSRVGYGSVLNQVQNVYNDFGQQTHSYQSHAGSVDLMNTPKVQYSYASGSANTIRMTGMTYPDGRGLSVDYGTAGDINDASSRVQSLKFTAEAFSLADYQYLGASGFVNQASSQPGINWTLYGSSTDPDTGDIYSGLDRFGRIDNCLWQKGTTTLAQIQYGYDRASNRTWRQDGVLSGYDELYQYDGLQRLKDQKRGTLNSTHTAITSSTFQQQWGLDATGNWSSFKQDDDGSGSWDLVQSRSANKVNEITSISNSTGTAWNTPLYDPAGNMIGIPNGGATVTGTTPAWVPFTESQWTGFTEAQWNAFTEDTGTTPQQITAQYDAWNRLVKVITTPLNFVEHVYDGRGFRIGRRTTVSNTVTEDRHYYYTPGWQCLEERVGSVTTAERQFVWGLRYIDDLVIRDRSTANNGTINERRYAMQDGNWNTIAICDTTGSVGERYAYSAYGAPVFMTGAGTVQTSSPVGFETLYAGYRWDNPAPQMYYVRNRFLLPQIGTWNKRDPLGYRSQNASLYVYARNNSIYYIDPLGLDEIDDYHRDLFNYYQSLMQVMILVGDELHANGTANLGKRFPWLAGKYNCTGGPGAIAGKDRESILFVQIPYRAKEPFPILWPELANAIRYSQKEYGDFEDWILVEGASLNLHGLWFLVITNGYPWLHLGREPFLRGPREAIETIIHEPQHDFCNHGAGHGGGMQNIVPCDAEGLPAASKYGSAYEQYIDFLQATKDEQGVSLWEKMEKWVGRKPINPIRRQIPQLPSFEEYEKRYPLSPIN